MSMSDTINPMLQWLNANPHWAGLATFLISAGESIAILGTIVPGSVTMTAIGTLAGAGVIPLWPTVICAILGAIIGDGISYMIGKHFKEHIRQIWPFRNNKEWLDKGEYFFHKHGGKSVFIGRFVGPVRAIVPVIAGMMGMKPFQFYLANITSAIGWAPAYMLPGIVLGVASLELPPDIAVHAILSLLMIILFVIFCFWTTIKFFVMVSNQIESVLNRLWRSLQRSRYAQIITVALRHHNIHKTHGQLVLAFYFIITATCFCYLTCYVMSHGSPNSLINNSLMHFFRSLRTPTFDQIMLAFTLLGEKQIVVPVIFLLSGWLWFTNRTYLAWHVLFLGILTIGGSEVIKDLVHSPRPGGIVQSPASYSFPSGHTTLSTVFFVGIALITSLAYPQRRKFLVFSGMLIALLVGISRLYLGAHWFTDVLAGLLLGASILIFISISYNRKLDTQNNYGKVGFLALIMLLIGCGGLAFHSFQHLSKNYSLADYPISHITETSWWDHTDSHIQNFRVNRFGVASQPLNVQWSGSLTTIQSTLLANGWETPPERDWISVLQRVTDVQSSENVPLVSPIHLDKKPVLILIKRTNNKKNVLVLRLWESSIVLDPNNQPLWVGTVSLIPSTYNWIFKKSSEEIEIDANVLLANTPKDLELKRVTLPIPAGKKHKSPPVIMLIRETHPSPAT